MKKKVLSLSLAIAVLLAATAGGPLRAQSTIRVQSDLVLVDALVVAKETGVPVGDLGRLDFVVKEDGDEREIVHFDRDELPLAVVILLDVSGSVQPVLDEIQRSAAMAFSKLKPEDRVAAMIFGSRPRLLFRLTTRHNQLPEELERVFEESSGAGYYTFINNAVYAAT